MAFLRVILADVMNGSIAKEIPVMKFAGGVKAVTFIIVVNWSHCCYR